MIGRAAAFTLHGLLASAVSRAADHVSVVGDGESLTYAELDDRSARMAAALLDMGVRAGDRVAVAAEKSPDTVAALYGIMRTGAAYVPIDPLAPPVRAAAIVQDADCRAVCADAAAASSLTRGFAAAAPPPILALRGNVPGAAVGPRDIAGIEADRRVRACESDLAYVLYTSGSTGVPKGVMLTHRNALAFVDWAVDRFDVSPDDRLSSHAPFHFDLSVFDLYAASMAGAALDLLSPAERTFGKDMTRAIADRGITVWYSVPSALVLLCDAATADDLDGLRVVLFAGEVFHIKHLRRLRSLCPSAVLANLYGPTETNVCTYHVVPEDVPADGPPLPIGAACENQDVFALDEQLRPVDVDQVGELWVRGPTVMKGYWGDPDRTAQSLRQNPLHDRFSDPAYRTGDLVRRLPGDVFDFLGRRDHQIKVRGYRVELGEIESVIASHPDVREAAVVAVPVEDERIGTALVGVASANGTIDELELKRHCRDRLPRYMIPGTIIVRKELPHTSTGKIDRQSLTMLIAATEKQPPE